MLSLVRQVIVVTKIIGRSLHDSCAKMIRSGFVVLDSYYNDTDTMLLFDHTKMFLTIKFTVLLLDSILHFENICMLHFESFFFL